MTHRHRAKKTETFCFQYCVNPDHCDPVSHGNICDRETCRCGAERAVNKNGGHREASPWHTQED